uniref:Reverse transcriptase domain-containing protein n=1 Tax=Graphocephala atropunctata TaxID=36148 RepID=A0A1B6KMS7_9HEMI
MRSHDIDRLNINNYRVTSYFCREKSNKGGVIILSKEQIEWTQMAIHLPENLCEEKQFEFCATVFLIKKFKFVLIGLYRSPNSNVNVFLDRLSCLIDLVVKKYPYIILAGDLNINVLKNSSEHVKLKNILKSFDMNYTVNFPTRVFQGSVSAIDNFLTSLKKCQILVTGVITMLSDHDGQVLEIVHTHKNNVRNNYLINIKRDFSEENKGTFKGLLEKETWQTVFLSPVNQKFDIFYSTLTNYFNLAFPKKFFKTKKCQNKWINQELKEEKQNIIKLNKKARVTNDLELSKLCKYKNKIYKTKLLSAKKDYFDHKIKKSRNKNKTTWNIINSETGDKLKSFNNIKINIDGREIVNPLKISQTFNDFFTGMISANVNTVNVAYKNKNLSIISGQNLCGYNFEKIFYLTQTDEMEVQKIINSFQNKFSSGHDDIPMTIIKTVNKQLSKVLVHLINSSFICGIFPDQLKIAKVIPIYKKNDPLNIQNYRPVSLLPSLSKIYEKVVYNRLMQFVESNNILEAIQHGFRKQKSTITAVVSFIESIIEAIDRGEKVIGIFMDLSKAFDSVNHSQLLLKLQELGVKNNALSWFESYLYNRKQFVQINHITENNYVVKFQSNLETINVGVPQGSILGPLLFLCYLNNIKKCLNFEPYSGLCLYADDSNLKVSGKTVEEIELLTSTELACIEQYFRNHNLTLNSDKTKLVNFKTKQSNQIVDLNIEINDSVIERVDQIKFLGLLVDGNLSWDEHTKLVLNKINSGLYAIRKMLNVCSLESLKLIYYSHIQSHIAYGICVYGSTKIENLTEILKVQIRADSG